MLTDGGRQRRQRRYRHLWGSHSFAGSQSASSLLSLRCRSGPIDSAGITIIATSQSDVSAHMRPGNAFAKRIICALLSPAWNSGKWRSQASYTTVKHSSARFQTSQQEECIISNICLNCNHFSLRKKRSVREKENKRQYCIVILRCEIRFSAFDSFSSEEQ